MSKNPVFNGLACPENCFARLAAEEEEGKARATRSSKKLIKAVGDTAQKEAVESGLCILDMATRP